MTIREKVPRGSTQTQRPAKRSARSLQDPGNTLRPFSLLWKTKDPLSPKAMRPASAALATLFFLGTGAFHAPIPPFGVDAVVEALRASGVEVATGRFGAMMQVESTNDGPVTIVLDSADRERPRRG